jgi:hypothetical protein
MYVAYVCFECFRGMFHLCFPDACCKCLSRCCICFTHMLHVFYLDIAYGCNGFQVFSNIFSSISTILRHMLQLLYLDISKVDQVLHLFFPPSTASSQCVFLLVPARHPFDTAAGSFQIRGVTPLPLLLLRQHGPPHGVRETKCSARTSRR